MILLYFLTGLIFGSFVSAISHRLPINKNFIWARSYCPKCKHILAVIDLIPLLSYIIFLGKCHYCKEKISLKYPALELFSAVIFVLIYSLGLELKITILLLSIFIVLLIMIIIDFEHYILPDSLQIILLILAIIWSYFYQLSIFDVALSAFIGFSSIYLIAIFFKKIRKKEGIGFGDIKFITIASIFIGWYNLPYFFLISGIVGVINGLAWKIFLKKEQFPFAPSLATSLFILIYVNNFIK